MQLGSFLDGLKSRPAVTRHVKFRVVGINAAGAPAAIDVEAVLTYVDEETRAALLIDAAAHLRAKFPDKPISAMDESQERSVRFLARALRDKADPVKAFGSADELRPALVNRVADWLGKEYDRLMEAEFPIAPDAGDLERMKEDAKGK